MPDRGTREQSRRDAGSGRALPPQSFKPCRIGGRVLDGVLNIPVAQIDLLYLSTQFLWWQAVAAIVGVTSRTTLRNNSRCTWRHSEGARHGDHTAIRHALSPLRPCGSGTADVHG